MISARPLEELSSPRLESSRWRRSVHPAEGQKQYRIDEYEILLQKVGLLR